MTKREQSEHGKKLIRDLVEILPMLSAKLRQETQEDIDRAIVKLKEATGITTEIIAGKPVFYTEKSKALFERLANTSLTKKKVTKKKVTKKKVTKKKVTKKKVTKKKVTKKKVTKKKVTKVELIRIWKSWRKNGGELLEKPFTDWASTQLKTTKTAVKYAIDEAIKAKKLRRFSDGALKGW